MKRFIEAQGYAVKGEICGCDGVGLRADEKGTSVAVIEMKMGFTLELLLQGVDRMAMADVVWLAVPASRRGRDRDRRVAKLCRLLGFGLLAVHPARETLEVLAEPGPYQPRGNPRRKARLVREHERRVGDPSAGGSAKAPIMTAYRQRALACAGAMAQAPQRPRDLAHLAPDAGRIVVDNVYGWFERVERGVYRLSSDGQAALERWPVPAP